MRMPYSEKNLSYRCISSHCPTAAHACFIRISFGRSGRRILETPTEIAPEETRITSSPPFSISESTCVSLSIIRRLTDPFSLVRVEVPTLTTILLFPFFIRFVRPV